MEIFGLEFKNIRATDGRVIYWTRRKKIKEFSANFFQNQSGREKTKMWASLFTYFPRIEKYSKNACGPFPHSAHAMVYLGVNFRFDHK